MEKMKLLYQYKSQETGLALKHMVERTNNSVSRKHHEICNGACVRFAIHEKIIFVYLKKHKLLVLRVLVYIISSSYRTEKRKLSALRTLYRFILDISNRKKLLGL